MRLITHPHTSHNQSNQGITLTLKSLASFLFCHTKKDSYNQPTELSCRAWKTLEATNTHSNTQNPNSNSKQLYLHVDQFYKPVSTNSLLHTPSSTKLHYTSSKHSQHNIGILLTLSNTSSNYHIQIIEAVSYKHKNSPLQNQKQECCAMERHNLCFV